MDAVVELIELRKTFGNLTAVNGLNLKVDRGEFFGLLGPNGAGKTSTIRMVTSLTKPTSGVAMIDGQQVGRRNIAVRRSMGVVPQRNNLDVELTVEENLELHGRLHAMPRQKRREKIEWSLNYFGLAAHRGRIVKKLSGGMKQRLMIARAIMHDPSLLVLDEPTVGLDASSRRAIWDLLRSLHSHGLSVLLTTHYIEEAQQLCDRVGLLCNGSLVACDTPEKLINSVGKYAVDLFANEKTETTFFDDRDAALKFLSSNRVDSRIRETHLEDVFVKLTDMRVEQE